VAQQEHRRVVVQRAAGVPDQVRPQRLQGLLRVVVGQ